jgi:hypothetical protein
MQAVKRLGEARIYQGTEAERYLFNRPPFVPG